MAEPNAAPATPTPQPGGEAAPPKIEVGQVFDIPGFTAKRWTVVGFDATTGRVMVNKRDGDAVLTRSVDMADYDKAVALSKFEKGRKKIPRPRFAINQTIGLGSDSLRISGYDALSGTVQVTGLAGGKNVTTWVDKWLVNDAAMGNIQAVGKVISSAAGEKPEVEAKKEEPKKETRTARKAIPVAQGPVPVTETKEVVSEVEKKGTEEISGEMSGEEEIEKGIRKTRDELRETREEVRGAATPDLSKRLEAEIAKIEAGAKAAGISPAERQVIERYRDVLRKDLEISQTGDAASVVRLVTERQALVTSIPALTATAASTTRVPSLQTQDILEKVNVDFSVSNASAEVSQLRSQEATLKIQLKTSPNPAVQGMLKDVQARLSTIAKQGAAGPSVTVSATATTAPAGMATNAAQVLARAKAGIAVLQEKRASQQDALKDIQRVIGEIGTEYADLNQQRQVAMRAGNTEAVGYLDTEMADLDTERQMQLKAQLTVQTRMNNTQGQMDALEAGIANLSQAESGQAPAALVTQVNALIPPSVPERPEAEARPTVEGAKAAPATIELPSPPPPRSYAPGLPIRRPGAIGATPVPGIAQRIRGRAMQAIGIAPAAATAVGLDAARQAERAAGIEGVGEDTYERAMATEGGHERPRRAPPSYTQERLTPEELEQQDIYEPGVAGRERQREKEAGQQATMESLLPSEAPAEGVAPEAGVPGAPVGVSGRPAPAEPGLSKTELDRATGLQAGRQRSMFGQMHRDMLKQLAAQKRGFGETRTSAEGIQRIKRGYDMFKAGTALTFWGIVITVFTMNVQLAAKVFNFKRVPKQSLVEDVLTVFLDIMLVLTAIFNVVSMLIIPAVIIAMIVGGALGISEIVALIGDIF